jgi:cytochrome c oxidase cbb3-type subunit 3
MKKLFILFSLLLMASVGMAQEAAPVHSFWNDPLNDPMFPLYVVMGFVFLVAMLVVLVAGYMVQVLNVFIRKAAEEKAAALGIPYVPEPGYWATLWDRINALKPVEKEAEIMLDHNYDGITELDNHLPPWWKWLFYITIIWGIGYLIVYHVTDSLPLSDQEYQNEVTLAQEQKAKLLALKPPVVIDENTLQYSNDEVLIQSGRKVYVTNCASCHLANGEGSIGPNLTDEYWIHGGSIKDIYVTIKNGVQEKGMIPWGPVLSAEQIRDVSFYIMSIRGSNPANPKPPQGTIYKEETTPVQVDSVKATL